MQKTLGILAFAALASGCTSTNISQALASGPLGCSPKEIVIADETVTGGAVHNFRATCAGVEYLCTYVYPNPISCREPAKSP